MEKNIKYTDILIIGAGTSGLFLASKFLNINKSVIIFESHKTYGGQLNLYADKHIYNIPLRNEIKAGDVKNELYENILRFENCKILYNTQAVNVIKNEHNEFEVLSFNKINNEYIKFICKYIVLACGKGEERPNKLPIKSSEEFENKTLLYSVENENIFKQKNIVIAGGGDSAIDWACELVNIANNIILVHRRNIIKPENTQFETFKNLCENHKIELKIPYTISELIGVNGVLEKIKLINNNDNTEEFIKCDYLLPFYGITTIQPNIDLFKAIGLNICLDKINVDFKTNETNIENIFAIGDCCNFEGKINNILNCFAEAMRCFYSICQKEKNTINSYEHR